MMKSNRRIKLVLPPIGGERPVYPASALIQSMPGIVSVGMLPRNVSHSALALPDNMKDLDYADAGVVLSSCDDRFPEGAVVLCHPTCSHIRFQDFNVGEEVVYDFRCYGVAGMTYTFNEDPAVVLPACLSDENKMVPNGDWVFVRRFPNQDVHNGIILTDSYNYRSCKAHVIAVGSGCQDVAAGSVIVYKIGSIEIGFDNILKGFNTELYPGDIHDYAFVREKDILVTIEEDLPWVDGE